MRYSSLNATTGSTLIARLAGIQAPINATGTVSLAGLTAIGWVVLAAAAGSTVARVKLCPGIGGSTAT